MSHQFPRDQYDEGSMIMDPSLANQWSDDSQRPNDLTNYQIKTNGNELANQETMASDSVRKQNERPPPFSFISNPMINQVLTNINPDLLVSKTFYFFFFSAFGSLFPLMAVYFKQLGMNPIQAGLLVGIRPFVEFIAAPFWSSIADKFHKSKAILLFSLGCWIVFTFSMAFIRPPASACVIFNETHHILYTPYSDQPEEEIFDDTSTFWPSTEETNTIEKNDTLVYDSTLATNLIIETNRLFKKRETTANDIRKWTSSKHRLPPNHVVGKSPLTVEYTLNYNHEKHVSYLSPPFSTIVYKWDDVKEVFFLLLLLVILGEFFSAPAITLADSATLDYLGEDVDKYGQQRMFGSFGWGITMMLVGIALDNSTKFKDHPCGPHIGERNYVTCFSIFAFLMSCTFLIAIKFKFQETQEYLNDIQLNKYENDPGPKPWQNTAPAINIPEEYQERKKVELVDRWKSAVFAQRIRQLPSWVSVLRSMNSSRHLTFLLIIWFMGFGVGLVFTFLFWHLQDLGGTPTLYGYASVINHISEIGAYFFSINLIKRFGHTKILCLGLLGNATRFIYVAWLTNPWWVLPFELIQGVTHATVWAAACSYIISNTELELRSSAHGVMQGVYQGLGKGSGSILGAVIIKRFGSRIGFFLYGLSSAALLSLFVHVNYYRKNEGYKFNDSDHTEDFDIKDSTALAPHGVPTNPIAHSVSRQNVSQTLTGGNTQELSNQVFNQPNNSSTGTTYQSNEYFDPNSAWN